MAQAPTAAGATSNLVNLIGLLQNMFVGSSSKASGISSGTATRTGTATENVNTTTASLPEVIQALMGMMNTANTNAANPAAVNPILDEIIRKSLTNFAPQLGREASAGLYNSTTRKQLAGQAAADAASAMSAAVLNYITGQQQVAANVGSTLAGASKTTAGSTTKTEASEARNSSTSSETKSSPPILGDLSNIIGLGALGYGLYKNGGKLVDLVSGAFGDTAAAGDVATTFADFSSQVLSPFNFLQTAPAAAAAGPTEVINLVDNFIPGIGAGGGGFDVGSAITVADDFGGSLLGGLGDIGVGIDSLGSDITDLFGSIGGGLDDLWSTISGFFSF